MFLSDAGASFALASFALGFLMAWCAYAISVITVPMLIDREVDGFTALRFSIKSVLRNMPAMMLWAGLIVLIVGLGMITLYIGLIVALPLIGHAKLACLPRLSAYERVRRSGIGHCSLVCAGVPQCTYDPCPKPPAADPLRRYPSSRLAMGLEQFAKGPARVLHPADTKPTPQWRWNLSRS